MAEHSGKGFKYKAEESPEARETGITGKSMSGSGGGDDAVEGRGHSDAGPTLLGFMTQVVQHLHATSEWHLDIVGVQPAAHLDPRGWLDGEATRI